MKRLQVSLFVAALTLGAGLLTGCPSTGIVCTPGLTPCGTGCADFTNDRFNCGACGNACTPTQVCVSSTCVCQPGALTCGSACVVPQTDPSNCGGCAGDGGTVCSSTQVCQAGSCVAACTLGQSTQCGQSCTNVQTDPDNCGACGFVCNTGQSCKNGSCTYDVVIACGTVGEVVGLQSSTTMLGPHAQLGSFPGALASIAGSVLLSADQTDKVLYEARLSDFQKLPEAPALGNAPNQTLVADPFVYVINSVDNTLEVLQRNGIPVDAGPPPDAGGPDAGAVDAGNGTDAGSADGGSPDGGPMRPPPPGPPDAGLGLVPISAFTFAPNSSPQWAAKISTNLYVSLWGEAYPDIDGGQQVVRVDVSNPFAPAMGEVYDLSTLNLSPFDGGVAIARPQQIVVQNGLLYVVLNNLDPNYAVAGPGLLAKIDPVARTVSTVSLGNNCLDPVAALADSANIYVVCAGAVQYDASFDAIGNVSAGLVMLSTPAGAAEKVLSTWNVSCPASSGGDAGCLVVEPFNLTKVGSRIYVGDVNGGRVFAVDVVGNQLVEKVGYGAGSSPPVQACPFASGINYSDVSSLLAP